MILYSLIIALDLFFFIYYYKNKEKNTSKRSRFIFLIVFAIILTVVAAIRYDVGTDYIRTYKNKFDIINAGELCNYEILFLWLNKAISFFGGNVFVLTAICSVLTIPMFVRFIKKNVDDKYWLYAIFLFVASTIYFATMNVIRQYLAIAILLFSFEYLKDKKFLKYFICCFIAISIHTSSIVFVGASIFYLLIKNKEYHKLMFIIYLMSIVFVFVDLRSVFELLTPIIPDKYIKYLNSKFFIERNSLAILKLFVPNMLFLVSFFYRDKLANSYKTFKITLYMWFIYVLLSNCFYGINVFIRLGWYFDYFLLLLVPMLFDFFTKNEFRVGKFKIKNFSKMLFIFLTIYYIALVILGIYVRGGHGVIPYHTILYFFGH